MWILFLLLSLINLFFISNFVLLISGWTMLHVQVPAINWLNSKFKITTRYSITSDIHTDDKKYETTKNEDESSSDSDENEEDQANQMDNNKIADDVDTEEEESEPNGLEVKNQLTQRKNMILIDESLD